RIKYAYPDRQMVDVPNDDTIFHTVYDLNDRQIIVGRDHLQEGSKNGGTAPRWVAVFEDQKPNLLTGWVNQEHRESRGGAGRPVLPGKILRTRNPPRRELHRLRDDTLMRLLLHAVCTVAVAQPAVLTGIVADPDGATVKDAVVQAKSSATGAVVRTNSSAKGE